MARKKEEKKETKTITGLFNVLSTASPKTTLCTCGIDSNFDVVYGMSEASIVLRYRTIADPELDHPILHQFPVVIDGRVVEEKLQLRLDTGDYVCLKKLGYPFTLVSGLAEIPLKDLSLSIDDDDIDVSLRDLSHIRMDMLEDQLYLEIAEHMQKELCRILHKDFVRIKLPFSINEGSTVLTETDIRSPLVFTLNGSLIRDVVIVKNSEFRDVISDKSPSRSLIRHAYETVLSDICLERFDEETILSLTPMRQYTLENRLVMHMAQTRNSYQHKYDYFTQCVYRTLMRQDENTVVYEEFDYGLGMKQYKVGVRVIGQKPTGNGFCQTPLDISKI